MHRMFMLRAELSRCVMFLKWYMETSLLMADSYF